ncbi:MAG TPA: arylsulfatase [Lentisphaeria bacterium]|nr:MAG: hypothetical protein A2X48_18830 [Lentisphaerae bacterium GWF2_49_21]HBC85379.1 arylsulfatase [Lentisphaeria bacterium]
MDRREFIKTISASALICTLPSFSWAEGKGSQSPNILFMLTDDQGYNDLSCYGSKNIKTPNLDKLAAQGMRFTDFYSASPLCSPSRAGLMTGRTPSRCGIYTFLPADGDKNAAESPMHLPGTEITISQLLKKKGYSTCHLGKWHLSHLKIEGWKGPHPDQPQPKDFGFDYSFGTTNNALKDHKDPGNFVRNGKKVGNLQGYSSQIVVDEGIKWLNGRNDKSNPFFMYLCFHEPHEIVAAPQEMVDRHEGNNDKVKTYFACIENMDDAAGRLLKHLDESGLAENTIVLFYSDNGSRSSMSKAANTNSPLRGMKADIWDGGIRVPGIMRWPGKIKPGSECSEPVGAIDMLPTFCDITGATVPNDRKLDGTSITPLFEGKNITRKNPLFWHLYGSTPAAAMRDGDWKIVGYSTKPGQRLEPCFNEEAMKFIKQAKLVNFELYNIRTDIAETKDVSAGNPAIFEKMKKSLLDRFTEVVAEGPTWTWDGTKPARGKK